MHCSNVACLAVLLRHTPVAEESMLGCYVILHLLAHHMAHYVKT